MMTVSVVIPTFRRQRTLRDLLGSLERQVCDVTFEVIVVANLPEAGLKKTVESYGPRFRFQETGRLGVNIARNKGLNLSRGAIVLFLDDDTYITDRDFIQKVAEAHARHPEALAIGGAYTPKAAMSAAEEAYYWILEHRMTSVRLERDEARLLASGNVSFKREFLETRHRFDDRVISGASEDALFARLRREQNLLLIYDTLSVEHRSSVGLWDLMKKGFFQGYVQKMTELDSQSVLERPHWNSVRPIEETIRSNHVEQTLSFRLALRLYRRFFKFGARMAARDSILPEATTAIKPVAPKWPEFSLATAAQGLLSQHHARTLRHAISDVRQALRSAFAQYE